ncbi:MAG: hypothetical protein QXS12_01720 [Candidatus Caldarchaeum sp.]
MNAKYLFAGVFPMLFRAVVAQKALMVALPALALKAVVALLGYEFMVLNPLVGSVVAGAIFVMGVVLAGLISDYKEAEKIPGEMLSALDRLWTEARLVHASRQEFDVERLRDTLVGIIRSFITGVEKKSGYSNLQPCIEAVNNLSWLAAEMERAEAPAPSIARVKDGRENLLKQVMRVYYIQRTVYLPSARVLAEFLTISVVVLLTFVKLQSLAESIITFAVISYFIIYLRYLTYALDTPFQQGERTMDDVSLFLLKEYKRRLASEPASLPRAWVNAGSM